jgi:hypothetical protein
MPSAMLPDALANALGRVVADVQRQARKDIELIAAECRVMVANLKLDIAAFKEETHRQHAEEKTRLDEVLAKVKDGTPGQDGRNGIDGKDGAPGRDGVDGAPGKDGAPGLAGQDGRDGIDGKDGAPGRDGVDGVPGRDGAPGKDGCDGVDADPELVETLAAGVKRIDAALKRQPPIASSFLIDEAGVLQAIYPDGATKAIGRVRGEDGERGASLMDGSINAEGQLVLRMSDGRVIPAGIVRGAPGRDGKDGERGPAGRDAIEVRILSGIDESKSYPEGSCARHRGGVVRAERQTDPVTDGDLLRAGWAVVLDGIAEESERVLDDGRMLERTTVYTSGRSFTRRIETAVAIYRGVWKEGSYRRGDLVTRDGSQWHCEKDTAATPGLSPDWRLCVKRGRDGKDGKPGTAGERGPPGTAGRDLTQLGFDGGKH